MAEVFVAPFTGNFASTYREMNKLPFLMWDNFANRSNVTASITSTDTLPINMVEENTVDFWKAAAAGDARVWVSNLTSRTIDVVAIRGHNFATIGATVVVSHGGGEIMRRVPLTDGVLVFVFPEFTNRNSVYIDVITTGTPIIGSVMVGKRLVIPNGIDGEGFRPIEFSTVTDLLSNRSQTGQLLANRVVRRGISADLPINPVDYSFVDGLFKSFVRHYNDGRPFVFASSPTLAPNDAGWFWRPGSSNDLDITSTGRGAYAKFSIPAEGVYS